MALNKFIHPRNPYRKPPNFKELALEYPDFRKFIEQDLSGKVRYNFKKHGAVEELTKTLLKKDFQLSVIFPPDRLVPTLTLRMNYLLWIEDMLKCFTNMDNICGVDIGTGASCIYPLLAARHFKWKMLATEIDMISVKFAKDNVLKNNLETMISVKKVEENQYLEGVIDEVNYDFCMCNPPFFSDDTDLDMFSKSRTPERNPPRNSATGSARELISHGGEISFVDKIIAESKKLGSRIKLYTVMVGHKRNVSVLKEFVQQMEPVRIDSGEFCQGRTMRWGLAWTFDQTLKDLKFPGSPKKMASTTSKPPFTWLYPTTDDLDTTIARLCLLFEDLQIDALIENEDEYEALMTLTAYKNTWSHSRRKRRKKERKTETPSERSSTITSDKIIASDHVDNTSGVNNIKSLPDDKSPEPAYNLPDSKESLKRKFLDICEAGDTDYSDVSPKFSQTGLTSDNDKAKNQKSIFIECSLSLLLLERVTSFSLSYNTGPGGREAANQLLQYLKNHLTDFIPEGKVKKNKES